MSLLPKNQINLPKILKVVLPLSIVLFLITLFTRYSLNSPSSTTPRESNYILSFSNSNVPTETKNKNLLNDQEDTVNYETKDILGAFDNIRSLFNDQPQDEDTSEEENDTNNTEYSATITQPPEVENISTPEPEPEPEPTPPPPQTCPQTTKNCVPCHKSELYCRYEQGEEYGYLGWACQNNNPSNIRYSTFRIGLITKMGGSAPCGEKGGFMVFNDYNTGRNSVKSYIRAINAGLHFAYITPEFSCGDCTLTQFFSKYAPNSTTYDDSVAQRMGASVTPDTKLNWIVDNRLDDFVEAIQCMEGYFIYSGGTPIKWCNL